MNVILMNHKLRIFKAGDGTAFSAKFTLVINLQNNEL